ncbi:MAG: ABC transporter permease [Actinomycetota bacterium]
MTDMFAALARTELKLLRREPVVLVFTLVFPIVTVLVLGGVFDPDDPAFAGAAPDDYYVAGYLGIVIAAVGLIGLPVQLAGYRERGVLRRLAASPFPSWMVPLAQLAVGMVLVAAGMVALLATAGVAYDVSAPEQPVRVVLGAIVGAAAILSVGLLLGRLLPSARAAQAVGLVLFLPQMLLSRTGPPPEAMDGALRTVSDWLPLTHVVAAVQDPWLGYGDGGRHLLAVVGILIAATVGWVAVGRRNRVV